MANNFESPFNDVSIELLSKYEETEYRIVVSNEQYKDSEFIRGLRLFDKSDHGRRVQYHLVPAINSKNFISSPEIMNTIHSIEFDQNHGRIFIPPIDLTKCEVNLQWCIYFYIEGCKSIIVTNYFYVRSLQEISRESSKNIQTIDLAFSVLRESKMRVSESEKQLKKLKSENREIQKENEKLKKRLARIDNLITKYENK